MMLTAWLSVRNSAIARRFEGGDSAFANRENHRYLIHLIECLVV